MEVAAEFLFDSSIWTSYVSHLGALDRDALAVAQRWSWRRKVVGLSGFSMQFRISPSLWWADLDPIFEEEQEVLDDSACYRVPHIKYIKPQDTQRFMREGPFARDAVFAISDGSAA